MGDVYTITLYLIKRVVEYNNLTISRVYIFIYRVGVRFRVLVYFSIKNQRVKSYFSRF